MYILIDRHKMEVLYRCEKVETVRALTHIELPFTSVAIQEECCLGAFYCYSPENLRDIFKSLTGGTDPHSYNKEYLAGQISRLCQTATPTDVEPFEVIVQSLQVKGRDTKCYRYVKGASQPLETDEQHCPPAITGNWEAAQALPLPGPYTKQSAPVQPQSCVSVQTVPPKYAPPWA